MPFFDFELTPFNYSRCRNQWLVKNKKKIVILGSGFAAVECAKKLENEFGNDP